MTKRIIIVIVGIIVVVLGRGFFFYRGFYTPPNIQMPSYEYIRASPISPSEFSDNPRQDGKGTILIDLAHDNNFSRGELNVLMLRLVSRGLTIKLFGAKDDLEKELSGTENKTDSKELKPPNALVIVCPQKEFVKKEKDAIDKFVDDGGKLLLIADPTRPSNINNISLGFGVIFEPDYLYNMKENEINYRNIFVTEFKESEITKSLKKIVLYASGSISSDNGSIAFTDSNTFSSVIVSRQKLSPIAFVEEAKVLAIHDLTFMSEPYNGTLDNNQLISNIADWLTSRTEKKEKQENS